MRRATTNEDDDSSSSDALDENLIDSAQAIDSAFSIPPGISMEDAVFKASLRNSNKRKDTAFEPTGMFETNNGQAFLYANGADQDQEEQETKSRRKKKKNDELRFWSFSPWHETSRERETKLVALRPKGKTLQPIERSSKIEQLPDSKFHFRSVAPIGQEKWNEMLDSSTPFAINNQELWCFFISIYLGTPDLLALSETSRFLYCVTSAARSNRMRLPPYHPMHLNEEQRLIYRRVVYEKSNIFLTGNAGTGKSFLLRSLMAGCENQGRSVQSVAVTGASAVQVGGMTVHQYLKIPVDKSVPLKDYIRRHRENDPVCLLAKSTESLFIDEVYMMTRGLFDAVDKIMRAYRNNFDKPFGGVQVICAGDPYQLRAITEKQHFFQPQTPVLVGYPHETEAWIELFGLPKPGNTRLAVLTKTLRQARDQDYRELLDTVRKNRAAYKEEQILLSRVESILLKQRNTPVPKCIALLPRREQVEIANRDALSKLLGRRQHFAAKDRVIHGKSTVAHKMLQECRIPAGVELREGCRVMLLKNYIDMRLCNGSQGTLHKLYVLSDPTEARELRQMLENNQCGIIGDDRFFLEWQTEKETFELRFFGRDRMNGKGSLSPLNMLPVVEFDSQKGHKWLVMPMSFEFYIRELIPHETRKNRYVFREVLVATREQLPLMLGYAFTIHKAQGMDLESARLDLMNCWEVGQVYSALSRIKTLSGLYLISPPNWITLRKKPIDPKIIEYDSELRKHCTLIKK